jgi:hypothetical protein
MAVSTFGVTFSTVHAHYFPSLSVFGAATTPLSGTVTEMIEAEAALLAGRLAAEGVAAATISAASSTYPNAYAWCSYVVRLGAAIQAHRAMSGDSETIDDWVELLAARYKDLADQGGIILGDAPTPSEDANGPRTHLVNHDIDTGDTDLISDAIPTFRRSDEL